MAYIIYKTNGQQLLTLLDGTLDSSRGVNLVGKNYVNFGTAQNENFVRLMENFANGTGPTYPLTGQLWYDTGTATLKYFDGTTFNILANAVGVTANVTALNSALIANVANLSSYFSSNVSTLTANAASQDTQLKNLWANAAIQASAINALTGVVTGSNIDISGLLDSTNARIDSTDANVAAANDLISTQSTAINGLTSSIDTINDTLAAHTVTQNNQTAAINAVQSGLAGANASILATNVAVRNYVDAQNLTQTNQINSLNSSVSVINSSIAGFYTWANLNYGASDYSNSDVAQFLPTYTGDVAADNVIVGTGVFWANGDPYVSSNYGDTNVANYILGNITAGNITATNLTSRFNLLQSGINGANAVISSANTVMTAYVDSVTTNWVIANIVQSHQITNLQSNIGSFYNWANTTPNTASNTTTIATTAFVQNVVPTGGIILWHGSSSAVPYGWRLCDGTNGTPNLTAIISGVYYIKKTI
jgi:hypothetical protein